MAIWDKNEIEVVDNQLSLATTMENQLVELETQIKSLTKIKEEITEKLRGVMGDNDITSYESPSKRLRINYTAPGTTETIDKEKLFLEFPEAYRTCIKESPRKASIRITVREVENE